MNGSQKNNFLRKIPGQFGAKELLSNAIKSGRLFSAYLFRGPAGVGKFASAIELVKYMKCNKGENCDGNCKSCRLIANYDHPDVHILAPLPREISESPESTGEVIRNMCREPFTPFGFEKASSIGIDAVRALAEKLSLATEEKGGNWAIIRDADAMTEEASNAFLKTLEEPPVDSFIILTSSRPDFLLPTIRSRTQPVRFTRLSRGEIVGFLVGKNIERSRAEEIARAAEGGMDRALKLAMDAENPAHELGEELWVALFSKSDALALDLVARLGQDRSFSLAVIEHAMSFLRDHLLCQQGLEDSVINVASKERIKNAARKYSDPRTVGSALRLLQEKSNSLRFNPQYDLFWMDMIIRGRMIIAGRL